MYLASAFEKRSQRGRALNLHSFFDNSEGMGGGGVGGSGCGCKRLPVL